MISRPNDGPPITAIDTADRRADDVVEDQGIPRDLRVALLEDILSLREHRIAQLEQRIETLQSQLEARDERLQARECERRQVIENYERILDERDQAIDVEDSEGIRARAIGSIRQFFEPVRYE